MIKNKKLLLILFSVTTFLKCYCQYSSDKSFVIITYEQKFSKSFEGIHRSFWITPDDSILSTGVIFYPILLSGYFKNDLDSSCIGKEIDPYFSSPIKENNLEPKEQKALEFLQTLIFAKRKKIQTIVKKWNSGNEELITIYATPILGSFCYSKFSFTGQKRSGYFGQFYIPFSQIQENDNFWHGSKAKIIMNIDFSFYNFDFNILYNKFPYWKKYGK
jgi:hypothetical protein